MDDTDLSKIEAFVRDVVRAAVHPRRAPFEVRARHLRSEPIAASEAMGGAFEPFSVGESWGGMWDTTWFEMSSSIDPEWAGETVVALIHLGGAEVVGFSAEGLVFDAEGTPITGLHHRHRELVLAEAAASGERIHFFVEAAANPIPKWHRQRWPLLEPDFDGEPLYVLEQAEVATLDRGVESLYRDMRLLAQIARAVPDRADEVTCGLAAALDALDATDVSGTASRSAAALAPLLASASESAHVVTAVGHAHIDSAWLWPVRETKRKCARTFANQLRLMERYPEHRFACSQAAQYQWIKEGYPALYEQIRRRVAEGRWEPVGGMWVEPDSNVPSGESLVRQFVYGKRFFAAEFGVESRELWIPDVFGYTAALPQIARQAGVDSLVTQKMSWNDTNVFPHSTLLWEGHDGSRVLAHFPPVDTYNGDFSAAEVLKSEQNLKEGPRPERSLYPFGYGDGGGGPTAAMLEQARRVESARGLPRVEIGPVAGFLDELHARAEELPVWVGELYLENHRATLTTHGDVKLANRRAEEALRAAEMWSVAAGLDRTEELDEAWKLVLFNQFHDILPGSSIHRVYVETAREHRRAIDVASGVVEDAQAALGGGSGEAAGLVAFNASSYARNEVVDLPGGGLATASVPACGWAPVPSRGAGLTGAPSVEVGDGFLENDSLRVTWDDRGVLTSVWDKEALREVLAAGQHANVFQLHEDHPRHFDAWNVDREYLDSMEEVDGLESIEVVERDPLRCGVRFARRFGASLLVQTVRLSAATRRLEFHTELDWHERHRFLKVAFPVGIRAQWATYEIQHGWIQRPTSENTSWDLARFEVCAHRWADLSEPGYGVALVNDCKYGYDIRGNVMRLSLVRGPAYPDPEADQGRHRFAYALLPHSGDLREGRVVEEAESFNVALRVVTGSAHAGGHVVEVDRAGVSVEALKWADDAPGVVVRICEVHGSRGNVRVRLNVPFESVVRTDVLEREVETLHRRDGGVEVALRPFELVTLKFL
jgi:alpha-mannosidase